jgi:hypothetical protein
MPANAFCDGMTGLAPPAIEERKSGVLAEVRFGSASVASSS